MDGWNTVLSYWVKRPIFRGVFAVSFREGITGNFGPILYHPNQPKPTRFVIDLLCPGSQGAIGALECHMLDDSMAS